MATLLNLSGFTYGIGADEVAINVREVNVNSSLEFDVEVTNRSGDIRGRAIGLARAEITVSGETTGTNGITAVVGGTAYSLANSVDQFGQTTGGCYATTVTNTGNRDALKEFSVTFKRIQGIT
jgi:hypothetical protein